MSEQKPNHICRACGKAYYACPSCDKNFSWRAMACSPTCYQKYMKAIILSRNNQKDKSIDNNKINNDTKKKK